MPKPTKLGKSYSVAFSRDGKQLSTIGRDVWLWDVDHRKKRFRAHPFSHPSHADFSPDGDKLSVKNTNGQIAIISGQSGEIQSDFKNDAEGEGSNVLYSTCGQYLVDGTWSGFLTVRRTDSGAREFSINFPGEAIRHVHRCDGSDRWVIAHSPKATTCDQSPPPDYFSVWKWPFRVEDHEKLALRIPFVLASSLSPDGQFIAVVHGAPPKSLSVFNLISGACVGNAEIQLGGSGGDVAWSPDQRQIALVEDGAVRLYTVPDLTQTHEIFLEYPCSVVFSPDGLTLAIGSWTMGWLLPIEVLAVTPNISLKRAPRKLGAA